MPAGVLGKVILVLTNNVFFFFFCGLLSTRFTVHRTGVEREGLSYTPHLEAYSERSQISKMERFAKMINDFSRLLFLQNARS